LSFVEGHAIVSGPPKGEFMRADRISASDEAARAALFRHLAEQRLEAAYRLACAILGNPAEAQDATHDAFVQAWRKWSSLRDPASIDAWFDRIVVNTCRNRLKRSGRWRFANLTDEAAVTTGDAMGQVLDREVLAAALETLSPEHQVVVALRYYGDLTTQQIAQQLGIRHGTVRSRLHYATEKLNYALGDSDKSGTDR
jgi:RNA polymerase sigma-70 factor (ECF subfamily)